MKNIVILLCLIFIAFSNQILAQSFNSEIAQDSLVINLQGRNQIFITGKSLKILTDYQRGDSLKNYFFEDLQKTLIINNFPETPKRIHYLVNQAGKRRLKAEIAGETESSFNLNYEKTRLNLNLPPLHYTIYDLPQNVEIHYFLEDTAAFKMAQNMNLNAATTALKNDKKNLIGLSAYKLEQTGFGFENRNPKRKTEFKVEALGYIGGMLLRNQLSPIVSYDVFFNLQNTPASRLNGFRVGFSYNAFVLSEFNEGKFQNINPGTYWHGILQSNLGLGKDNWGGLIFGQIYNSEPNGLPNKAIKWGIAINSGRNSFSLDGIELEKYKLFKSRRKQLFMVTYRRSIL